MKNQHICWGNRSSFKQLCGLSLSNWEYSCWTSFQKLLQKPRHVSRLRSNKSTPSSSCGFDKWPEVTASKRPKENYGVEVLRLCLVVGVWLMIGGHCVVLDVDSTWKIWCNIWRAKASNKTAVEGIALWLFNRCMRWISIYFHMTIYAICALKTMSGLFDLLFGWSVILQAYHHQSLQKQEATKSLLHHNK